MSEQRLTVLLFATALAISACSHRSASTPGDEPDMRRVIGARFLMGTDPAELQSVRLATGLHTIGPLQSEVPQHPVTVDDFWLDTYSVTNAQFEQFVQAVPRWRSGRLPAAEHNGRYLEHWRDSEPADDLLDHPVTFITWHAAVAYCEWRDRRLPTEAEFEWAAQEDGTRAEYPWGNAPPTDDLVNWGGNGIDGTVPVGSYPPNGRGLYDMSGNVWHFTADPWLGPYSQAASGSASAAGDPDIRRVVRGGSFGANAANLRVRYRDSHRPYDAREMVGFRCAKSYRPEE